jgi:gluconate 2-dehydrogenase gamma chain
MDRREALAILAAAPLAAIARWPLARVGLASEWARRALEQRTTGEPYVPTFFTAHEYETVNTLVDLIIPRDERSGSATDAGVPEFMDFMMTDDASLQTGTRGGLAWLDAECHRRSGKTFVQATDAERTAVLDDIAWPAKARPEMSQGVAFFNDFRDLTASGFWSSKLGVQDIGYLGNQFVGQWNGCPPEQLQKLGVSYDR